MATSLPKGLNQPPSSTSKKEPNSKEITVIIKFKPKNKGNLMFLDEIPTTIMNTRNTGIKNLALFPARWQLYSKKRMKKGTGEIDKKLTTNFFI